MRKIRFAHRIRAGILFFFIWLPHCTARQGLVIGDDLPDIALFNDKGSLVRLRSFIGQPLVIYFYPRDFTPGCTQQACSLRDGYQQFKDRDVQVIGISYDTPSTHRLFRKKHALPFTMLSDTKKIAAKAFGAYRGWLRAFFPERVTYIFDRFGKLAFIVRNVNVATHAAMILEKIDLLAPEHHSAEL